MSLSAEQITEKYYSDVYKFCCSRCRNADAAQDITQDTFLLFVDKFDELTEKIFAHGFLPLRIISSMIISENRRLKTVLSVLTTLRFPPLMTMKTKTLILMQSLTMFRRRY